MSTTHMHQEDLHGLAPQEASFVRVGSGFDSGVGDTDRGLHEQQRSIERQPGDGQRVLPPQVRIDEHAGAFKYVLLEMVGVDRQDLPSNALQDPSLLLVRGSAKFNFHKQNVIAAQKELEVIGLPSYEHISAFDSCRLCLPLTPPDKMNCP